MDQPTDDAEHQAGVCVVEPEPHGDRPAVPAGVGLRVRALDALVRYVGPGLAAIALVLVLAGERANIDDDLQLISPREAVLGEPLPLRALLYTRLDAPEGPVLQRQPVVVRLESMRGQLLAQTRLLPSRGSLNDLEGTLSLPARTGSFRLRAEAQLGDHSVRTHAPLRVSAGSLTALSPQGRRLRALQQFSAGPVIAEPGQTPPAALNLRVRGGACVPEQPCRALLHVGAPAAAVRVEANSTLTPSVTSAKLSAPTDAIVALDFVTHGPEAELWLIVERDGRRVARRAVRLPVALGALSVRMESASTNETQSQLKVFGADAACIVDAFHDGHWSRTGSLAACQRTQPLPFAPLPAGAYRVQARADVFSAQTSGVSSVYLPRRGETLQQIAAALAAAAHELEPSDSLLKQCPSGDACASSALSLEYFSAIREQGVFEPPPAATGYADRLTQLRERQARLRDLSLVALALGGLSLVLHVGRRGLSAGTRARELLQPESLDPEFSRRTRWRSVLVVVASTLSLVLVFVVIALYVLARGGF